MTAQGFGGALLVGLVIGALGRLVVPGRQAMPVWLTIVVGIIAALLGSVVANALGSGFLESPAINGFLPAISRRLLNAELLLPSLSDPSTMSTTTVGFARSIVTLSLSVSPRLPAASV